MHCGVSLSELRGALVFHRKCLGKRLGHQKYMLVFVGEWAIPFNKGTPMDDFSVSVPGGIDMLGHLHIPL